MNERQKEQAVFVAALILAALVLSLLVGCATVKPKVERYCNGDQCWECVDEMGGKVCHPAPD